MWMIHIAKARTIMRKSRCHIAMLYESLNRKVPSAELWMHLQAKHY